MPSSSVQHTGSSTLNKIIIITALALLVLFFKVKRVRIVLYLAALAMMIGALFGPPKYLVMQGYEFDLPIAGEGYSAPFNFAWDLHALDPVSAKRATLGLYRIDTKTFLKMDAEEIDPNAQPILAQAALPFYLPGNGTMLHMWWWIFPAVFIGYWLIRKLILLYVRLIKAPSLKQALAQARALDTVLAYEQVLNRCDQRRWWKPRAIMQQAHEARDAVFERYQQRIHLLEQANNLAAANAQSQEQKNASQPLASGSMYRVLQYALQQRQLSGQSALPIDVRLNKNWWANINKQPVEKPSIAELESLQLTHIASLWRSHITEQVSLDQLRDAYRVDGKTFTALLKQLVSKAEVPPVHESTQHFLQYVVESLAAQGITDSVRSEYVEYIVQQYFTEHVFAAVRADRNAKSYQRSFEYDLSGSVAKVLSMFFPDETLDPSGQPLFSKVGSGSVAPCVFNIDLYLEGRRLHGWPLVTAKVAVELQGETIWTRSELPSADSKNVKSKSDAIGNLDATAIVGAAFAPPRALELSAVSCAASLGSDSLHKLLKELDDAAKELVKGNAEDIALDALSEFWRGEGGAALMQFDAVLQASIEANYTQTIEVMAELAASGFSFLGGDD